MRQEQAIGALLICLITTIIAATIVLVPKYFDGEDGDNGGMVIDSVLIDSLQRQWEAAHPSYQKKAKYPKKKRYTKYVSADTVKIEMQHFDPNTADSLTLLRVGLRPWQAKGILHYRAKGGRYRKPEDMKKLYGMTDSMYQVLEPWIEIVPIEADTAKPEIVRVGHEKRDTILELNTVDSLDLQYIRGIGPYYAKQIVIYRQKLGGYVDVRQLAEIKGVPADSIYRHFTVDTTLIRVMQVNHASVSSLTRHPYITYNQARELDDLRHRRTVRKEEDLIKYGIFSSGELDRLRPYLRYDK